MCLGLAFWSGKKKKTTLNVFSFFCARASHHRGLSPSRPLLLRSTSSRRAGSAAVAHGPSCSAACGILPDQGSNPCPLHRQADSQPLRHQGSPECILLFLLFLKAKPWSSFFRFQSRHCFSSYSKYKNC